MRTHSGFVCAQANFHTDCTGMQAQLAGLAALVRLLDPQLTAFLARREATTFYFCYRWLLIHFKREFAFDEARPMSLPRKIVMHVRCQLVFCI